MLDEEDSDWSVAPQEGEPLQEEEHRQRIFIPPPPVPDPSLVGPAASSGSDVPEPVAPPVDLDALDQRVVVVGEHPTLAPAEEQVVEAAGEPVGEHPTLSPGPQEPEPIAVEPAPAAALVLPAADQAAPEDPQPVEDDEDWSWHEEASFDEVTEPVPPEAAYLDDSGAGPAIDDLYGDSFDPSPSEIADDVFGDHQEPYAWLKWVLVALLAVIAFVVWGAVADRSAPVSGSPVVAPPPPPMRPASTSKPAPEPPPIDLESVVQGGGPEVLDLGLELEDEPPEEAPPTGSAVPRDPAGSPSSSASRGSGHSGSAAPAIGGSSRSSSSHRGSSRSASPPPPPVVPPPQLEPVGSAADEPVPDEPATAVVPAGQPVGIMDHLRDGWSNLDQGNLVGAQGAFMSALGIDSGNGMAHYGLGQVAERAKDHRSASYHYGRALQVLGGNANMRGELELSLRRVGAKLSATAPAAPAVTPAEQPGSAEEDEVQVTRKKRDELEESFRQELWDEDESE